MDHRSQALRLIEYLDSQPRFSIQEQSEGTYDHMGATIADAILQAGTTYATVVRPRVKTILERYPAARTTTAFIELLNTVGAKTVLNWADDEKPNRVVALASFLHAQAIDTEEDLRQWLSNDDNHAKIQTLKGVGPKTADYLRMLVQHQTTAVDRHAYRLLEEAGLGKLRYEDARAILDASADTLGVERTTFDYSVWLFMSQRRKRRPSHAPSAPGGVSEA